MVQLWRRLPLLDSGLVFHRVFEFRISHSLLAATDIIYHPWSNDFHERSKVSIVSSDVKVNVQNFTATYKHSWGRGRVYQPYQRGVE